VRAPCILLTIIVFDPRRQHVLESGALLLIFPLPFCADALLPKTAES
jgi:hypothetical protein